MSRCANKFTGLHQKTYKSRPEHRIIVLLCAERVNDGCAFCFLLVVVVFNFDDDSVTFVVLPRVS